ncbi:uncharacterized protein [Miscanthus floridulus]|uniref:uncharacterized protein n=1 Tax=Miscanthus floridulus TaxID=154761 RepID=UPI00345AB18D
MENPEKDLYSTLLCSLLTKGTEIVLNGNWKKPSEGFLMINVDASYNEAKGAGSTGTVIRDAAGGFIVAAHNYIPHVVDTPMAEAFALRDGLLLAQQIGCTRVEIQADCLEVATTMKEGGFSATAAAAIYKECCQYWEEFAAISISHCNRECIPISHELAGLALVEKSFFVWIDDPPSSILKLLVNDAATLLNQ